MKTTLLAWRTASGVMGALPPYLADRIARGVGTGVYYLWFTRRRVARENFARVLSRPPNDPRVGRVVRAAFSNYSVYILNMMRYPRVHRDERRRRVHFNVDPAAHAAMQQDKPMILVSAHFGNMDYAAPIAVEHYRRMTLAAETIKPVELFEYFGRLRSQNGVDLIPYDRAPRKIIEAIKRKEIVGFLIDFGVNSHKDINTVPVRFFGEMTSFPASPAVLAQRYAAPLLVAFARICDDGDTYIDAGPPIEVPRNMPREQVQQETMQKVAERFEKSIRAHPEQWYVFRPMWPRKPRPSGRLLKSLRTRRNNSA